CLGAPASSRQTVERGLSHEHERSTRRRSGMPRASKPSSCAQVTARVPASLDQPSRSRSWHNKGRENELLEACRIERGAKCAPRRSRRGSRGRDEGREGTVADVTPEARRAHAKMAAAARWGRTGDEPPWVRQAREFVLSGRGGPRRAHSVM